jgi:hypothetical protein
MSRIWYGIVLLCVAGACNAQMQTPMPEDTEVGQGTSADVRHTTSDPAAVEIPLYKGALIADILTALTEKGFKIKWSTEQVLPTMRLLEKPTSTRIDFLLNEILAPWDLHADHNAMEGGYRVKAVKKKKK